MWVKVCSLSQQEGEVALKCMIKYTFNRLSSVDTICMPLSGKTRKLHPACDKAFPPLAFLDDYNLLLSCAERRDFSSKLQVRLAQVEDHDDLLPIVNNMGKKYPELAKLPDSVKPDEKFALARLIESDAWKVLVALDDKSVVGMMCLQEVDDLEDIKESFELDVFDNLVNTIVAEEEEEEEEEQKSTEEEENGHSVPTEEGEEVQEEPDADFDEETKDQDIEEEKSTANQGSQDSDPEAVPQVEADGPAQDTEELKEEDGSANDEREKAIDRKPKKVKQVIVEEKSLAFGMIMFCINEEYEQRAVDFLDLAFELFPSRDYCIATLLHNSTVPDLLQNFFQASPTVKKLSPDVLYVLHRYSLLGNFQVQKASPEEQESIFEFLGDISEQSEVIAEISKGLDANTLFKATCEDQIVGICAINLDVDSKILIKNFNLNLFSDNISYKQYNFAEVTSFMMNPIFAHQKRYFLSNIMNLIHRDSLCFLLKEDTPVADVLDIFKPISQKAKDTLGFALYTLDQSEALNDREAVNSRIVVIGASSCGISSLEHLILNRRYNFTSLTLVTPSDAGQAIQKLSNKHASLAQIRIITSSMVEVDREDKLVYLDDGTVLPYEILVLTSGVEDQLDIVIDEDLPVIGTSHLPEYLESTPRKITKAIVYGGRVDAYNALTLLENQDIPYDFIANHIYPRTSLVKHVASESSLSLLEPKKMILTSIKAKEDSTDLVCSFINNEGEVVNEECSLFVMADMQNINKNIFECLNNSSIVYDGRLVVDESFSTTDEYIFGGGTLAKFTRKYGKDVMLENYNSVEVGQMLGSSIISKCEEMRNVVQRESRQSKPPCFRAPVGFAVNMPSNGGHFTYVCLPPLIDTSLKVPEGGRMIKTIHEDQLSIVVLDNKECVHSLCFFGHKSIDMEPLKNLIGLHVNYFKQSKDIESVACIISFLKEGWAGALYSDLFVSLRKALLHSAKEKLKSKKKMMSNTTIRGLIQTNLISGIANDKESLSAYHIPYSPY